MHLKVTFLNWRNAQETMCYSQKGLAIASKMATAILGPFESSPWFLEHFANSKSLLLNAFW
jgi:hypothetical protein